MAERKLKYAAARAKISLLLVLMNFLEYGKVLTGMIAGLAEAMLWKIILRKKMFI